MERMIRRYVKEVLKYLPIRDRRKARAIITATIYERLEEYTDGFPPIKKDVKAVLRELGNPAKLAYVYYDDFHTPFFRMPDLTGISSQLIQIATILAFMLVAVSVVQLMLGGTNIVSMIVGTMLAVMTKFYQVVVLAREEFSAVAMKDSI